MHFIGSGNRDETCYRLISMIMIMRKVVDVQGARAFSARQRRLSITMPFVAFSDSNACSACAVSCTLISIGMHGDVYDLPRIVRRHRVASAYHAES